MEYLLHHEGRRTRSQILDAVWKRGGGIRPGDRCLYQGTRKKQSWTVSLRYAMSAINWRDHDQTKYLCKDLSGHLCARSDHPFYMLRFTLFSHRPIESQRQTILKKSQATKKFSRARKKKELLSHRHSRPMISRSRSRAGKTALEVRDDAPEQIARTIPTVIERKIQTKGKDLLLAILNCRFPRKRRTSIWASSGLPFVLS